MGTLLLGQNHLHILLLFSKSLSTRDRRKFDFVCGKHGNYQTCRSSFAVVNYLKKSDKEPLSYGKVPQPGQKGTGRRKGSMGTGTGPAASKATKYATAMLSGSLTALGVLREDPGYFLLKRRQIDDFYSLASILTDHERKKPWPSSLKYTGKCPATTRIVDWLNLNIKSQRSLRQKQLFIYGPKEYFKSTILALLNEFLRLYEIPKGEDYYDFYDDEMVDLCFLEEFKGQKPIQWLNQFLDGESEHFLPIHPGLIG